MRQDREKRGKNLLSLGLREMRKGKYFLVKLFFSISSFIEFSPFLFRRFKLLKQCGKIRGKEMSKDFFFFFKFLFLFIIHHLFFSQYFYFFMYSNPTVSFIFLHFLSNQIGVLLSCSIYFITFVNFNLLIILLFTYKKGRNLV